MSHMTGYDSVTFSRPKKLTVNERPYTSAVENSHGETRATGGWSIPQKKLRPGPQRMFTRVNPTIAGHAETVTTRIF